MTSRRGEVSHVGREIAIAAGTIVLGVGNQQVAWPVTEQAANIVQGTVASTVAEARATTAWAKSATIVT
jgi:hypothetical protein